MEKVEKKSSIRRLWISFAIFLIFATTTLLNKDLLLQFGSEALSQSQKVLGYVIQVGIWLSAAHFLNRLVVLFFWDGLITRTLGAPVPRLIKDVTTVIVYLIAVTGIVGIVFNQPVTGFWATSGVVGLVLGLALRSIILDIFTGLAINIDRSYKIGDWIKVHHADDVVGQVTEINWRTTKLYTEDDSVVVLPNSLLGTAMVTNYWGAGPESRFDTEICLDFSIPTDRACRILEAGARAAIGHKGIREDPAPNVIVNRTDGLGVIYKVRYWMDPWGKGQTEGVARGFITSSILAHLKQAGITPAYPKQDIFYAEMPERHLDIRSIEDRTKLLGEIEMFKALEELELRSLASRMAQRRFARGEKLIKQGENGHSMFILSEGLVHAFLRTNGVDSEIKVGQIVPGEFFGEMSLLTGEPRSATIVATTEVIAHEITKEHLNGLLSNRPEIAETISKVVAHRRVLNSQALATATPEEKIEQTESMARQIMGKMKAFFKGVF